MKPLGQYMQVSDPVPSPSGKTQVWSIFDRRGTLIGTVSWYGPWRQYSFRPTAESIFNSSCMTELATFCAIKTKWHRDENRKRKMA